MIVATLPVVRERDPARVPSVMHQVERRVYPPISGIWGHFDLPL